MSSSPMPGSNPSGSLGNHSTRFQSCLDAAESWLLVAKDLQHFKSFSN